MSRSEEMSEADFGLLVSYLAQNGVAANVAQEVLGTDPAGRTRQEIADELREWLRTRPKG